MKAYVALMFAKPEDIGPYGREVANVIKTISGGRMQFAEGGALITAIGFATNQSEAAIQQAFVKLHRPEQRTWVLPLDGAVYIDKALTDWAKKQVPESPF
jgi:hypothetical protein